MLLVPLAILAAPLLGLAAALRADDPHRQFDFWIGEWSVLNRHIAPDGSWVDGDTTRARITPVCGGMAVLEEWAGPFRGSFMNGFSLRAYDRAAERWRLVLFWTTDGDGGFGLLEGRFRHGRGEFFTGAGDALTRYTFSDALPDTVRWDSARTTDGGRTWATDWIMEFTRTRAAAEVTQARLFATDWTEGALSPHPEARRLDWVLGTWRGTQTGPDGVEREARLSAKLLDRDCLVLDLLETRAPGAEGWDERLAVRGWASRAGRWEAWGLSEADPRLVRSVGVLDGDLATFERADPDGATVVETLARVTDDRCAIERVERGAAGGATPRVWRTELVRVD